MKRIIGIGMVLVLAGCGMSATGVRTTEPEPEGWYNPDKTSQQLSQDLDECKTKCLNSLKRDNMRDLLYEGQRIYLALTESTLNDWLRP